MQERRLRLHQELMLLALEDREGTTRLGSNYAYGIGGAILAELLLDGRIRIEERRRKKFVGLIDDAPLGAPVLDTCLGRIAAAKRRATLQTWVSRFSSIGLKHQVARELCRLGVLRADESKVLFIFKKTVYPELDPAPERELIERLRRAIFTDAEDLDPRTVILVSLARSSDLLRNVFPKKDLKARKRRIERVVNGEVLGRATREAIEAAQAAVVVAAIIPAVVTTTAVHS